MLDMRHLTYFLTCEVNIMPFFLMGKLQGLGVSLNTYINVMNYLWVLPLWGESSNKLRELGYFWEMNEQSAIIFKKFKIECQNQRFPKKIACFSFKNISCRSVELSPYVSHPQVTWPSGMTSRSLDGLIGWPLDDGG